MLRKAAGKISGIAVATTMVVDGLLGFIVIWKLWKWPIWKALALITPLVVVDVTFFSANMLKLFEGAWVPLLFGIAVAATHAPLGLPESRVRSLALA